MVKKQTVKKESPRSSSRPSSLNIEESKYYKDVKDELEISRKNNLRFTYFRSQAGSKAR